VDLIISDNSMPGFSGTEALAQLRSRGLDIPFIFVSGTMGEISPRARSTRVRGTRSKRATCGD